MDFTALKTAYPEITHLFREGSETDGAYLFLQNADGKSWLLPLKNLDTALAIYQPSSAKGKLLRTFLPAVKTLSLPLARKLTGSDVLFLAYTEEFKETLKKAFDGDTPETSVFFGTPGTHRKITMQFFKGNAVYAYGKLSSSPETAKLITYEKDFLTVLAKKDFSAHPAVIHFDVLSDDSAFFIQSTEKTKHAGTKHKLDLIHYQTVVDLIRASSVTLPFIETDYATLLFWLRKELNSRLEKGNLPDKEKDICEFLLAVSKKIKDRESEYEEVTYAMCHGDFTPWNTYMSKDGLELFDFEYARHSYPYYYDIFHFVIQTAYFEKRLDADGIDKILTGKLLPEMSGLSDEADFLLVQYLFGIIALYIKRSDNASIADCHEMMPIWLKLLKQNEERVEW